MNKKLINMAVILVSVAFIFVIGCSKKEKTPATQKTSEATPLVIDTPEPRTDGKLTILDSNGDVYFQYSGEISIKNNGKNGKAVDIEITLPDDGVPDTNTLGVVLYDKDTQSIRQYLAHPEYEHGVLKLVDAEQTYLESDSEWEETY